MPKCSQLAKVPYERNYVEKPIVIRQGQESQPKCSVPCVFASSRDYHDAEMGRDIV